MVAFWARYPDADKTTYGELFKRLQDAPVSEDVGLDTLRRIKARSELLKLSETAFRVSQGLEQPEKLHAQWEHLEKVDHQILDDSIEPTTTDLDILLNSAYQQEGYRWRLNCLNKSLGSLRPGDFGFIFARPETGKTTFLASEITSFLGQQDGIICWINNEEQGNKVLLRVYQAYFGCTVESLMANPQKYKQEFQKQTRGRLKFFDSAAVSKKDIEQIVAKYTPSIVVYDQIDKIKGFQNDRDDLRLGSIYQWARELAKGQHAAIGVCQADGHAEGVRYLTMEHVANAKTSKQAEADWIIGIGKTNEDGAEYVRFLNISKNKLLGDKDSIPDLRHGRFEVLIQPEIARYKDIVNYG